MAKAKMKTKTVVRATAVGFHDKLYQPGEIIPNFHVREDKSNLGSWMEEVEVESSKEAEED